MDIPKDARGRLILRRMGKLWLVDVDWLITAPGGHLIVHACNLEERREYFYGVACSYPAAELEEMQRRPREDLEDF